MDYPGFGLSVHPKGYCYLPSDHAAVVAELVEHLDLQNAVLVGQDWGGPIGFDVTLADRPMLRITGMKDVPMTTKAFLAKWDEMWPNATKLDLPRAGHFWQENEPAAAPNPDNKADLATYQQISGPLAAKHGAMPVAQLPVAGQPVGQTPAAFVAIAQFPSADAVQDFFADEDYQAVVDVRDHHTSTKETAMTVKATTSRSINASQEVVWEILDDFPAIAAWSAGIQNSFTTGDAKKATGLGAERRCELGGKKVLDERIAAYTPGESMTIDVWNVQGLPLRSTQATFSVRATGDATSKVTVIAEVEPKIPGFMQAIMRPLLSKGIANNFSGLLDELATEAEARVTV